MRKKILTIIAVLLFIVIIAACDNDDNNSSDGNSLQESSLTESEVSSQDSLEESYIEISTFVSEDESSVMEQSYNTSDSSDIEASDNSGETSSNDTSSIIDISSDESNSDTIEPEPPVLTAVDVPKVYLTATDEVNHDVYVDAKIRVFDPEGNFDEINDDTGSIRIRGNSTSSGAKKPYNIKFSSKETLLGLGKAKKWCLLANMYDKTLIRNKLSYDFATEIGMQYVSNSAFVDVYLNNVYLGNYLLTEAVDVGGTGVDIDTDGNEFLFEFEPWEHYSNPEWIRTPVYSILLGFNDPEAPSAEQRQYLDTFFSDAENALTSKSLKNVEKYFDIPSMVDFYIVNEYFKNVDFSTSSTRFYLKAGKIYGGPVWDFDLSAGNCYSGYYKEYNNVGGSGDSTEGFYCQRLWYSYLFKCNGFSDLVKERYLELQPFIINLTTDNELGKNKIDRLLIQYGKSFDDNYKKAGWIITRKDSDYERVPFNTYDKNISYLREWLIKRNEWLLEEWDLK
ncbi:MAG: hypothetical protein A2Y15_07480 [Clostridiales bacterium GWF2_36_10]|nr:MAG: hypothetical protein A2Y15_07480 [Clostridiales bacterium GWF2_36_10]